MTKYNFIFKTIIATFFIALISCNGGKNQILKTKKLKYSPKI